MSAKTASPAQNMVSREGTMPDKSNLVPEVALSFEDQKKKDMEPVRAIFKWYENPGASVTLCYRRYKEEKVRNETFTDGQVYTVPYGQVRYVNENCAYPEHSYLMDANGNPIPSKRKGYQRMEFIPTW